MQFSPFTSMRVCMRVVSSRLFSFHTATSNVITRNIVSYSPIRTLGTNFGVPNPIRMGVQRPVGFNLLSALTLQQPLGGGIRMYGGTKPPRWWKTKPGLGKPAGRKLKTHKGLKKRIKVKASGKLFRMPLGKQHLNIGTSGRKGQTLRKSIQLNQRDEKTAQMMLLNVKTRGPIYRVHKPLKLREVPLNAAPSA